MVGGRRGVAGWVSGGWLVGGEGLQAGLVEDVWWEERDCRLG